VASSVSESPLTGRRGLHWKWKPRGKTRATVPRIEEILATPFGVTPASATKEKKQQQNHQNEFHAMTSLNYDEGGQTIAIAVWILQHV
jgi:hypothetical protein